MQIQNSDWVWVENPSGRRLEVARWQIKELLERGYRLVDGNGVKERTEEKEYLDVFEI